MLLSTMIATVFAIFITHALRSFAVIYYSSQNAVSTGCFGITSKRQIVQVMIAISTGSDWSVRHWPIRFSYNGSISQLVLD